MRPGAGAVQRGGIALGPCMRRLRKAVTYRRDNAVNLRFIFVWSGEFMRDDPGCLFSGKRHEISETIKRLFQFVYGVNTPWQPTRLARSALRATAPKTQRQKKTRMVTAPCPSVMNL